MQFVAKYLTYSWQRHDNSTRTTRSLNYRLIVFDSRCGELGNMTDGVELQDSSFPQIE
jgi:hypothetical protein